MLTFMVMPDAWRAALAPDHLVQERQDRDRRVRRLQPGAGAEIHADRRRRSRPRKPSREQRVVQRLARQPPAARIVVEGHAVARRRSRISCAASSGRAGSRRRPAARAPARCRARCRRSGLADAGQLQQLRRVDRAAADDDLARGARLALLAAARCSARRRSACPRGSAGLRPARPGSMVRFGRPRAGSR